MIDVWCAYPPATKLLQLCGQPLSKAPPSSQFPISANCLKLSTPHHICLCVGIEITVHAVSFVPTFDLAFFRAVPNCFAFCTVF